MAHVQSQTITITVSKLVKEVFADGTDPYINDEMASALEAVVEELLNDKSFVVEVTSN